MDALLPVGHLVAEAAIALGDGFLRLLQTAGGIGSPRLPVFPAHEVFLKRGAEPSHSGGWQEAFGRRARPGRMRRWCNQSRMWHGKQALAEGLTCFDEGGGGIGFSVFEKLRGVAIDGREFVGGLCVPCFAGRIGWCSPGRGGWR